MKHLETLFYYLIVSILPLFIILSISINVYQYYSSIPKKNIIKVIGCVKGRTASVRGFHSAIVEFKHKGKTYNTETEDNYVIGEKFIVEFEKYNPTINKVRQDEPVFLEDESVGYSVGYVERLNFRFMKTITFIYYVNGIKYEQSYEPSEDLKTKYPLFKEGEKFIVKYWIDNPARSIILPYKPTDKSLYPTGARLHRVPAYIRKTNRSVCNAVH